MSTHKTLNYTVSYFDTDRDDKLTLASWFRLMQEVAIRHANDFNLAASSDDQSQRTWVLNRVQIEIFHYPSYMDNLDVTTWSTGVVGFKGYRDYAFYLGDKCIAKASSIWIYLDPIKRMIVKVPKDTIGRFPTVSEPAYFQDLGKQKVAKLLNPDFKKKSTLRYDDVDGNRHINNTIYLSLVQTALLLSKRNTHPQILYIQFQKEIPTTETSVCASIENDDHERSIFAIHNDESFSMGWLI